MLDIVASYHVCNFKENQWSKLKKKAKDLILGLIYDCWARNRAFFFFKNLASLATRYHSQLSSCTIPAKTNDPVLRKLSEGRTHRRTRVISSDAVRLTSNVQHRWSYWPKEKSFTILFNLNDWSCLLTYFYSCS